MWKVNYNPIWNVDGVEVHEIVTEYGKITRMAKNTTITDEQKVNGETEITYGLTQTDEQKVDAETEVEYGQKLTDEQKVNGSNAVIHGKQTTTTNPTSTGKVAAMDSIAFVNASESSATNTINTDSGTDTTTTNLGTVEHASSGKDTTTTSIGKVEHANSGKDTTTTSMGKVEHAHSGTDTDTQDGSDTTTDTLTRHGNIGVTMTQQLLTAEDDFWSHYSFFTKYFNDIANVISLPIYE